MYIYIYVYKQRYFLCGMGVISISISIGCVKYGGARENSDYPLCFIHERNCSIWMVNDKVSWVITGIDHNTVCTGVVGIAIRHSTSCSGRHAAAPARTTSALPDCSTNHDSADRLSGQFLFSHNHNFTKSKGNLRFRRLATPFILIGVCVTTHDRTASDVTIGMWRYNQHATTHEPTRFEVVFGLNSVVLSRPVSYSTNKNTSHTWKVIYCVSKFRCPWSQGSWGQHGVHLGPTRPMWAPCWPHEPCYLGCR